VAVASDRLRRSPIFDEVSDEDLATIAEWFDEEGVRAGHHVTSEGASGYAFFVIDRGEARVLHGDREVRRLGPGDEFGEAAIIGDGRRTASVVAETDLVLLALFGTRFRELQRSYPDLSAKIESLMRERSD